MRRYTVEKPEHGSQEWLYVRWANEEGLPRISASAAAAVHNEHTFTTATDLAIELLASDPPEPKDPNSAMVRGQKLEPVIIKWTAEMEGLSLAEPTQMYAYEEDGVRLIATLDAMDEHGNVFEIKTISRRWTGELPRYWYWQGVQQAICADVPAIEWAIFDSDMVIHRHTQVVTSDEKRIHIEACRKFLSAIDNGEMPENCHYEYRHATDQFPQSQPTTVTLSDEAHASLGMLRLVQEEMKKLEAEEANLKGIICKELGENEYGEYMGDVVCTWKSASRRAFDTKKFEQDHPALASKYKKETTYRTFKLNKGGK